MKRDRDALLVGAAAFALYLSNLGAGFVYDDRFIIEHNPLIQERAWWTLMTSSYWGEIVNAGLYRPLTLLTFALNRAISADALGFHLVNNVLHAAVSVLVWRTASVLGAGRFVALTSGLLFAVHPIQTEAVTSIVGRAELLAVFFALASFLAHVSGKHPMWTGGLFFLGLLSKETAAFALALFVIHFMLFEKRNPSGVTLATLAYLAVRVAVLGSLGIAGRDIGFLDNPVAAASLGTRLLTALALLVEYVRLVLWPRTLSADYSFDQIAIPVGVDARVAAGLAVVALAAAVLWKRDKLSSFATLAFLLPLGGFLHLLFPVGTLLAERLSYLPMVGAAVGLSLAAARLGAHRRYLVAALVGVLALRTGVRNQDWKDNETLFRRTVETSPRSARSHFLLGSELSTLGRPREATAAFERGLQIYPHHVGARMSLGEAYLASGEPSQAATAFADAYELAPADELRTRAVEGAMAAGRSLARNEDWPGARAHFEAALRLDPRNVEILNQLGLVAEREDDAPAARRRYEEALAIDEEFGPAVVNLASVLMRMGDLTGAESAFRRAVSLAPRSYEAYNGLGIALARQGREREAEAAFRRAIAIEPDLPTAKDNLRALGKTP